MCCVTVSPYLKSLSMVAASKLLHLLEAFSTPWFLYSNPNNHHLVFFLLEVFNNIIQYQFDGKSTMDTRHFYVPSCSSYCNQVVRMCPRCDSERPDQHWFTCSNVYLSSENNIQMLCVPFLITTDELTKKIFNLH